MNDRQRLDELTASVRGTVWAPDDDGYDAARTLWNGMVDGRPAGIVRCTGVADVMAALAFARDHGLRVTVRAGGHGVAGRAMEEGALVVDVSAMRSVTVDPRRRVAWVSAGARLGDLDHETQAFGLATTAGIDSRTGVAGLTLGGGMGFLARRFGLTVDNLRAVETVTAGGEFIRATEDEYPDVLWAARGGRGVGVVTRFELDLHPVGPEVQVVQAFHPVDRAAGALAFYRDLMAEAPDTFGCYALFLNVPPDPAVPAEHHGKPALALVGCHSDSDRAGADCIRAVEGHGEPISAAAVAMPYTTLQSSFDAGAPSGARYYWKAHYLRELGDEAIAALVEGGSRLPGPYTIAGLEPMGGAIARVPPDATAFPHRDAAFTLGIWAGWENAADDEAAVAWTRKLHQATAPFATGGVYGNYLDTDDQQRLSDAYGPNRRRLEEIRQRYDPDGLIVAAG